MKMTGIIIERKNTEKNEEGDNWKLRDRKKKSERKVRYGLIHSSVFSPAMNRAIITERHIALRYKRQ